MIGARERASEVCVMRSDRKYCARGLTCEDLRHGSALPRCHAIKTKPDATDDLAALFGGAGLSADAMEH